MQSQQNDSSKKYKLFLKFLVFFIIVLNLFLFIYVSNRRGHQQSIAAKSHGSETDYRKILKDYAGSQSCAECHPQAYEKWRYSHHALAERELIPAIDRAAFEPPRKFKHGTQTSEARINQGIYEIITKGPDGVVKPFKVERVFAVSPLRQFLIKGEGGRYQVTELAVDSNSAEWFDVYGDEDRQPGEWGHWTGRGMTWNSMCAVCHNTRFIKNYNPQTDTYDSRMSEMGVGCEACHGALLSHNNWQKKNPNRKGDPTIPKFTTNQWVSICGSCHSRRSDLNGNFKPGNDFFDHFILSIPDETDVYYPDGQVRDEDFELAAFLSSKMSRAGVSCLDCHEPHTYKNILSGNALCLRCHGAPIPPAPKIDPQTHSFHKQDTSGFFCKDCHMPQTVYMQRHARRDHGFSIPDPLMTIKFNIPNACNRCHTNQTAQWSVEYVEKWYGEKMNRWSRERTTIIALAKEGKGESVEGLIKIAKSDPIPLWRAAAVNLLKRWSFKPEVQKAILVASEDPSPLARGMAARALETFAIGADSIAYAALNRMLQDNSRSVRVQAAYALRATLDTNSTAANELMEYIKYNSDQPAGLLQLGVFYFDRGEPQKAIEVLKKAILWETNSAPLHYSLAICYSACGRAKEAVEELEQACKIAPRDAEYKFKLALAYNEIGQFEKTIQTLEEAVKLDPEFDRAWYNLGLAYDAEGESEKALNALNRAEVINEYSAQYPYARATILYKLGRFEEARKAALRALQIEPNYKEAQFLIQNIK
ncbi:MAG: ammonia-forming cytochrome c nitrite reductase subunit c552 [Verrucomicrobiia bacterium]